MFFCLSRTFSNFSLRVEAGEKEKRRGKKIIGWKEWVRAALCGPGREAYGAALHKWQFLVVLSHARTLLLFSSLLWKQVWSKEKAICLAQRVSVEVLEWCECVFLGESRPIVSLRTTIQAYLLFFSSPKSVCLHTYMYIFKVNFFHNEGKIPGGCHGNSGPPICSLTSPPLPPSPHPPRLSAICQVGTVRALMMPSPRR